MKKIISVILTLAMLVSVFALFPATVLAADEKLVIGTTTSFSGTTVVDSGGNVASDTGIGWTYASNTNTLTISFGFIGDITVNTLGTLNLAVSGTVTTGGLITMAAGDTVNITSGTLTCDNINGAGDVAITGCSVSTTNGILADDITITNAFIITNGDIAAAGNVTINSGTVSTPSYITGAAVNITGGSIYCLNTILGGKSRTAITLSGAGDGTAVSAIGGVTYNTDGMKTLPMPTSKIYLYLATGQTVTSVTAGGKTYYGSVAAGGTATFVRHATGTMNISGTVEVGSTLTASVSSPDPADAAFTYTWYRDSRGTTQIASGTDTYTIVEADIGKRIVVEASCTNYAGDIISGQTAAVPKVSETAKPATPTTIPGGVGDSYITAGATGTAGKTIELQVCYTSGAAATGWLTQTGSTVTFTGLSAATTYKVYARYKETATRTSGPVSEALTLTTTQRVTPTDPVASNMIYGIYDGNVFERSRAISFIAIGGGMDNAAPIAGDTRYVPINWFVNPSGVWVTAPYYATIPANSLKVGWHTLTVTYRRQVYSGTAWVSQTTAPQTVTTTVRFYITGSNNPKTGEGGGIWLYVGIIAGVAMIAGSAVMISARRRKNTQ